MADALKDLGFEDETDELKALGFEDEQPTLPVEAEPLPIEPTGAPVAPAAPPRRETGPLRALASSGLQGFFKGGSDELIGFITRSTVEPGSGAAWRQADGTVLPLETKGDVYRAGRDTEREVLRGAEKKYSIASRVADFAGDIGSDLVLSCLGVPGVGGQAYNIALGALSGFNRSDADLSDGRATPETAMAAGTETVAGAAMGYVAPKVGEKVGKVASRLGTWAGRKLGNALSEGAPSLEDGLRRFAQERALKAAGYIQKDFPRAAAKLQRLRAGGQTLLDEPGLITPGASVTTIAERLEPVVQREGEAIGRYLDEADASALNPGLDYTPASFNPYPFLERARREVVQPALEDPSLYPQGRTLNSWLNRLKDTDGSLAARGEPFTFRRANEVKGNLQKGIFNNRGDVAKNKELANQIQRQMVQAIDEQAEPLLGRAGVEGFQAARSRYGTFKEALDKATQGDNRATGNNFLGLPDLLNAQTAAAAGGGAPGAAVAAGASKLLRGRVDSMAAVGADRLARSGALQRLPGPDALAAVGASAGAVAGRAAQALSTMDWLNMAVGQNPDALGPYAQTLAQAQQDGRLASVHYVLEQTDPEYRATLERARTGP